jgi:hypothetical protein
MTGSDSERPMTLALGTPQRGQTIAPDDDRFAISNSLAILDRPEGWEDPQKRPAVKITRGAAE